MGLTCFPELPLLIYEPGQQPHLALGQISAHLGENQKRTWEVGTKRGHTIEIDFFELVVCLALRKQQHDRPMDNIRVAHRVPTLSGLSPTSSTGSTTKLQKE